MCVCMHLYRQICTYMCKCMYVFIYFCDHILWMCLASYVCADEYVNRCTRVSLILHISVIEAQALTPWPGEVYFLQGSPTSMLDLQRVNFTGAACVSGRTFGAPRAEGASAIFITHGGAGRHDVENKEPCRKVATWPRSMIIPERLDPVARHLVQTPAASVLLQSQTSACEESWTVDFEVLLFRAAGIWEGVVTNGGVFTKLSEMLPRSCSFSPRSSAAPGW